MTLMQIELKDYPVSTRIGLDFLDAGGIRRTSIQLVRADGYSIATADFANGKLVGHSAIDDVELPLFFGLCERLLRQPIVILSVAPKGGEK